VQFWQPSTSALRDMPEQHRTIRSVFEATWQRLNDDERKAFSQRAALQLRQYTLKHSGKVATAVKWPGACVIWSMLGNDRHKQNNFTRLPRLPLRLKMISVVSPKHSIVLVLMPLTRVNMKERSPFEKMALPCARP